MPQLCTPRGTWLVTTGRKWWITAISRRCCHCECCQRRWRRDHAHAVSRRAGAIPAVAPRPGDGPPAGAWGCRLRGRDSRGDFVEAVLDELQAVVVLRPDVVRECLRAEQDAVPAAVAIDVGIDGEARLGDVRAFRRPHGRRGASPTVRGYGTRQNTVSALSESWRVADPSATTYRVARVLPVWS